MSEKKVGVTFENIITYYIMKGVARNAKENTSFVKCNV